MKDNKVKGVKTGRGTRMGFGERTDGCDCGEYLN